MSSSVLLGKRLRRQIKAKVWPTLEEAGFGEFTGLRAFRRGERTLDVVEFAPLKPEWHEPRWIGGEARANGATFSLHVGSYYVPVGYEDAKTMRPHCDDCHRCACLAHESMDSVADGRTFYPGASGERLDAIVDEAVRVLQSRGMAILAEYADIKTWLEAVERGDEPGCGPKEEPCLTPEEATEMLRLCRGGRSASTGALDGLHRRIHLSDDHRHVVPNAETMAAFRA